MRNNSFHKAERLKSRKSIEGLFKESSRQKVYPFLLLYREVEKTQYPALMTVAVPKKQIGNAVDRNLIKRRTREAYRLLKNDMYEALNKQDKHLELLFLYQSGQIEAYETIASAVQKLVTRITK